MGINIDLSNVVIGGLIIFATVRLFPTIKYIIRKKSLASLLNKNNDTDAFLEEIEKDINKNNSKIVDDLLLDKAVVLMVKGELDETSKVLQRINPEKLSGNSGLLYYYYLILNLFEAKRIDEAKTEFVKHYKEISKLKSIEKYRVSANKLEAMNLFFSGEIEKSQDLFLQLLNMNTENFNKAEINFFLGLINKDLGKIEEAKKYFVVARKLGEATLIEKNADAQLKELGGNSVRD